MVYKQIILIILLIIIISYLIKKNIKNANNKKESERYLENEQLCDSCFAPIKL